MITWKMLKDRLNRVEVYSKAPFWDEAAEKNYKGTGFNLWNNSHLNELYHNLESDIILKWAGDVSGAHILDLGCGAGRFSRALAQRGATVTGIDFSAKSIEIARRMTSDPNISYEIGSVFDVDATEAYDSIICAKVLTVACKDVLELRECLSKIRKALKPGGRFLSIEMCHTTFVRRVLNLSYANFKMELEKAGFEILDSKAIEFIPARMALAFFDVPRPLTVSGFTIGEQVLKIFPRLSDQKLTYAKRTDAA